MNPPSIVFLAHFDWSTHFMQFHKELLREFANLGWKTLWVSGPNQARADFKRWLQTFPRGELCREGSVWHYRPWALPGLRFGAKFPLPYRLMAHALRQVLAQLEFHDPVILVYTPYELHLIRRLPHSTTIYWTGDEVIIPRERELLDYVDVVLAVSPPAYEEKRRIHPKKTFQVSTGVAFEKFNQALSSDYVPPDLRGLKRPIIGYAGAVSSLRLDLDLLDGLVRRNPEYTFALVGPVENTAREFFMRNPTGNVCLLGPKDYEQVPHYIKGFDVCIIPYLRNRFNLGSNPLKLYEYLALGKPVVTTALPAIEKFSGVAWVARDFEEFQRALSHALAEKDNPHRVHERLQVARDHSAQAIAQEIVQILSSAA